MLTAHLEAQVATSPHDVMKSREARYFRVDSFSCISFNIYHSATLSHLTSTRGLRWGRAGGHVPQTQRSLPDYERKQLDRKTADATADTSENAFHSSHSTERASSNYDHQNQDKQAYAFADHW